MPVLSYLRVLLGLEADEYAKQIEQAKGQTSGMTESMKGAGQGVKLLQDAFTAIASSAAIGKTVQVLKESIREADTAARVQAQVGAVIQSTGGIAGVSADMVGDLADSYSHLTGVEDDLIARQEAVMLTFTKVGNDIFPDAIAAALDMSAALDQSLQTSIISVGKALNDFDGFTALKRQGVSFTETQVELVDHFRETNDLVSYQNMVLHELQTEFSGAAAAMYDAGSKSEGLANSVGNLKEAFGTYLLPTVRETNEILAGWADRLEFAITTQNELDAAVQAGIITQQEANDQINTFTWTSYSAADAQNWLKSKTDEYNASLGSGQSVYRGADGKTDRAGGDDFHHSRDDARLRVRRIRYSRRGSGCFECDRRDEKADGRGQ